MKTMRRWAMILPAVLLLPVTPVRAQGAHYPKLEPRYMHTTWHHKGEGGRRYDSFRFNVPANTACLAIRTGQDNQVGWGTCHLYARRNRNPTRTIYDYRRRGSGHRKTIVVDNPATGNWYVRILTPYVSVYEGASVDARMRTGLTITAMPRAAENLVWRQQMLDEVNRVRTERGLSRVSLNDRLNNAAQFHADEMGRMDYYSNVGRTPLFRTTDERARAAGYDRSPALSCRQNWAAGVLTPAEIVAHWMSGSGNRQNLLRAGPIEVGFGCDSVHNPLNPRYVAVFARPR